MKPRNYRFRFLSLSAFTIIELLMVLAVIGLSVGIFVVSIDQAIAGVNQQSVDEVVNDSFRKARLMAVMECQSSYLQYNEALGQFEIRFVEAMVGAPELTLPLDQLDKDLVETIRFWAMKPVLESRTNRKFQSVERSEYQLEAIEFEPTGVSHFAALEIQYKSGVADSTWILMDPFSNGVIEADLN